MVRKRVAILISGRGSNMSALIEAAADPSYPAEIVLVVSNRPDAAGLAHAQQQHIPTAVVDHKTFATREAFDQGLDDLLMQHNVELVCLAGFMRLLTPGMVARWQNRMLNIHPALLPAFKGLHTHERALSAGVKTHGATVHFVASDVDSGPIIVQEAIAVHEDDTAETLDARVLEIEHRIYPLALSLVAGGHVTVVDGRCRIDGADAIKTV